jgi:hypothetical protein
VLAGAIAANRALAYEADTLPSWQFIAQRKSSRIKRAMSQRFIAFVAETTMATPRRKASKQCTICTNEKRYEIELALVSGVSTRAIAKKFTVSRDAVWRHGANHVPPERRAQLVAGPLTSMELAERAADEGMSLLDHCIMVRSTLMKRFLAASEADDRNGTANVAGRLLDCLRLMAALTGELTRATAGTTNNIAIINSPFVSDLHVMLLRTLSPFPDARRAVLEGLEELSRRTVPDAAPLLGRVIEHSDVH